MPRLLPHRGLHCRPPFPNSSERPVRWRDTVAATLLLIAQTDSAQGLGMTGAMGTVSEIDDAGFYTGQLAGPLLHGPEKAKAVERVAAAAQEMLNSLVTTALPKNRETESQPARERSALRFRQRTM